MHLAKFVTDLAYDFAAARRGDSGPVSARVQSSLSAALQVLDSSHPDASHNLSGCWCHGFRPLPVGGPGLAVEDAAVSSDV
jgi:hypothetical protein